MNEQGAQLREEAVPGLTLLAGLPDLHPDPSGRPRHVSLQEKNGSFLTRSGITSQDDTGVIAGEDHGEHRLYVFDREHLDADPETIANALAITEDQVLSEPELGRQSFTSSVTFTVSARRMI